MSWSDDIRCLYCDGRLPLYRKITHGQFCSSAHRKEYWQEQERLAVERLHQTHTSLQAFVPPTPQNPEDLRALEMAISPQPANVPDPVIAGHFPATVWAQPDSITPALVASDPLEYEIELAPRHPASAVSASFQGHLPVAGLVEEEAARTPRALPAQVLSEVLSEILAEAPSGHLAGVGSGAVAWIRPHENARRDPAPREVGPLPIPVEYLLETAASEMVLGRAVLPLVSYQRAAQYASLTLPPVRGELDRMMDQLPHPEQLFLLSRFGMVGLRPAAPKVVVAAELPTQASAPLSADLRLGLPAPVFAGAGRMDFAPRSAAAAAAAGQGLAGIVQAPALAPLAVGPKTPASLETPLPVGVHPEQRLPLASGVLYSVSPRITPLKSAPEAPAPASAPFARPAALPPLLLEVDDSIGGWMVPPAHKIPFGKTVCAPAPAAPLTVLVLAQPLRTLTILPASKLEPADPRPGIEILVPPMSVPRTEAPAPAPVNTTTGMEFRPVSGTVAIEPWWAHARGFWKNGPRDLKILLLGIPLLIALAFHPRLPKVRLTSGRPTLGISQALQTHLATFRHSMAERAAVALDEDFRGGLDDWNSRSGDATGWSYDATGFVKPGPLALYNPSLGLTNYEVQFLGMIGKKSLSWVVRAADFDNYYVVKLVERKGGPLPQIGVTRYAVINGKAQGRVDTTVAISARPEMMYLVRMDVKGDDFAIWVQDQMVDNWSESRLPRGGVGFYSAKGEESLVRWVQITHQYDMLGRLCAYLAPNNFSN